MILKVSVKTNSPFEKVEKTEDGYKVYITEKPIHGKANEALIKVLKKFFKQDVEIVSGMTSSRKLVKLL